MLAAQREEGSFIFSPTDQTRAFYLIPGTNINEALMKAVQMLLKASNQGLIDPRSVSMIILVSDGDPTVGKYLPKCFAYCSRKQDRKLLLSVGR